MSSADPRESRVIVSVVIAAIAAIAVAWVTVLLASPASPASPALPASPATSDVVGTRATPSASISSATSAASADTVPRDSRPPGADDPDHGPAPAVFPPQSLPLRFSHKQHVLGGMHGAKIACLHCHAAARQSTLASDWLIPKNHDVCAECHAIDDKNPMKGTPTGEPPARCDACHLGTRAGAGGATRVPRLQIPLANLKMNHKAHLDLGIKCQQCHGEVENLELATRDQMPRMKGCLSCHQSGDGGGLGKSARAKSACPTCHVTERDGVIKTVFPSGVLTPPRWLKNAQHGAGWIERHKRVAGADSAFCGNCHREKECTDCHDGSVRPRSVHPGDWLNMHAASARFDQPKCASCHSTTNFCVTCHLRVGVAKSSPSGVAAFSRFHPPANVWSSIKRTAGHHSFEAQKNITACTSCHVERDCVACHGTQGVGGAGANPHGGGFTSKCSSMFRKNPRPCVVCHDPGDRKLDACK